MALAHLYDGEGDQKGKRSDDQNQQDVPASGVARQLQIVVAWIVQEGGCAHAAARLEMPARGPPTKEARESALLRRVGSSDRDRFRDDFWHGGPHHEMQHGRDRGSCWRNRGWRIQRPWRLESGRQLGQMNVASDHGPRGPVITRIGGLVPVAEETKSGLGTGHGWYGDYQARQKVAMR